MRILAKTKPTRALRRDLRGAAALEFALVTPLFIMLVFGVISFGMIFAQQLGLSNGARQAARAGVVKGVTCATIYQQAQDASTTVGLKGANVSVVITRGATSSATLTPCGTTPATSTTQPCTGSTTGDSLYVKTTFTSQLIIPPIIFKKNYPISSIGAYECEYK